MVTLLLFLFGYLMGSIPVGILLSRLRGKDPRKAGSGNIGATNVMRTAGKTLGIVTLLGDVAKGVIPTVVAAHWGGSDLATAATGLAAFLGHLYPVFLRFRGGKGISTLLGIFLVLSPASVGVSAIVFVACIVIWRYVSLGSLAGVTLIPLWLYLFGAPWDYILLSLVTGAFVWVKHKENVKRLLAGTENRFR